MYFLTFSPTFKSFLLSEYSEEKSTPLLLDFEKNLIFSSLDHKLLVLMHVLNVYTEWICCNLFNHFPSSEHLKYSHNFSRE